MLLPDYAVVERDGRLLVGMDPTVRQRNAVAYANLVLLGGPALVALVWWNALVPDLGAGLAAALFAGAGVWMLTRSANADCTLDARSALVIADRVADRIAVKGRAVCDASDVALVVVRASSDPESLLSVLELVTQGALLGRDPIVVLEGLKSHLEEPARRLGEWLGVPVRWR